MGNKSNMIESPKRTGCTGMVLLALLLGGCTTKDGPSNTTLNVYAASSLTEAFQELATEFETRHANTKIALNFGGSQTLRLQIEKGAPAHSFASASEDYAEDLRSQGLAVDIQPFAETEVALIVPANNPRRIERLDEIHRAEKIVLAHKNVPIGQYTARLLKKAQQKYGAQFLPDIQARTVSRENSVRKVRAKISMGEADAAFVYSCDVTPESNVRQIRIPPELRVKARYVSTIIKRDEENKAAVLWNQFLLSRAGQKILRKHGFSTPALKR